MKHRGKNPTRIAAPVVVEIDGVPVKQKTALWLLEHSELHGDTARNMAGRILDDVAEADMLAHDEFDVTLH